MKHRPWLLLPIVVRVQSVHCDHSFNLCKRYWHAYTKSVTTLISSLMAHCIRTSTDKVTNWWSGSSEKSQLLRMIWKILKCLFVLDIWSAQNHWHYWFYYVNGFKCSYNGSPHETAEVTAWSQFHHIFPFLRWTIIVGMRIAFQKERKYINMCTENRLLQYPSCLIFLQSRHCRCIVSLWANFNSRSWKGILWTLSRWEI